MKQSLVRRTYGIAGACAIIAGLAAVLVAMPCAAYAQDAGAASTASPGSPATPSAETGAPAAPPPLPPAPPVPPDTSGPVASPPPVPAQPTAQAAPAAASPAPSHHFWVGPEVGVFLPSDSKTRNQFGSSWFSIGIGFGQVAPAPRQGAFGVDLDFFARTGSDRHMYIVPLGIQYRQALASGGTSVPYAGVSADIVFGDVRDPYENAHSGLMTTGGGSVFIGSTLGRNAYIEARYLALGSIQGFGLSGLNLGAGLRF